MTDDDHPHLSGPLLALRDQLVDAADRMYSSADAPAPVTPLPPARTRSRASGQRLLVSAAAAVFLGIAIVGYTLGVGRNEVSADVDVHRNGDQVTVSIESNVTPSEIERALKDAGVKVTIEATPTGPSRVNRFVGIVAVENAKLIGGDGTVSNQATFVAGSRVKLKLGVAANGRKYDASTQAIDHGEPLEGTPVVGKAYADVRETIERRAAAHGATIVYWGPNGQPAEPDPAGKVLSAQAVAADEVIVVVG